LHAPAPRRRNSSSLSRRREGLSQAAAAKLLGVTEPRVSDLVRGKIDLFGLNTLVNMAAAGLRIQLQVDRAA
jgi:predicted XRE-type DNA-binding protein